jgi:NAD-dependent deacetylase
MTIESIVILTGAGISAESGVPTFRASDGLWCGHRVEDVATPEGFIANPELVHDFYNRRRRQLADVHPNQAHLALAEMAMQWEGDILLVTQNVDDLHERAFKLVSADRKGSPHPDPLPEGESARYTHANGAQTMNTLSLGRGQGEGQATCSGYRLIHMHGELRKGRCLVTDKVVDWDSDMDVDCGHRPHIVWFGEMPLEMEVIYRALRDCDLFISIGTSGNVYPAAGFVAEACHHGAHTVELNLEPSLGASMFHEQHYGPATQIVPDFLKKYSL